MTMAYDTSEKLKRKRSAQMPQWIVDMQPETEKPKVHNTLSSAWGEAFGLTFGTFKFFMQTRRFRWVSRFIMFPLVFVMCPAPVVGLSALSFAVWRAVRMVQRVMAWAKRRKARKASEARSERSAWRRVQINIEFS